MWQKEELVLEKQAYCGDWAWRNRRCRSDWIWEWPLTAGLRFLPQALFLNKKWRKKSFGDWLIKLANRGFGMSTDAFLKSVTKFPDKKVRIIPLTAARVSHHTPVICYVLFHDAGLYFWNRLPGYFASAREAYKSLGCRNLCTITLLLLCPDTGQHRSSAKILISRWKQRQKS